MAGPFEPVAMRAAKRPPQTHGVLRPHEDRGSNLEVREALQESRTNLRAAPLSIHRSTGAMRNVSGPLAALDAIDGFFAED